VPDNATETPPERVMRQWYQGKLAERMGQFGAMLQSRELLRRGALKQQDGTLGQPGDPPDLEDDMQIRVGDEVHYHQEATPAAPVAMQPATKPEPSLLAKAAPLLLAAAIGASGVGIPAWMAGAFSKPAAIESVDTDTQYLLELVSPE